MSWVRFATPPPLPRVLEVKDPNTYYNVAGGGGGVLF